MQCRRHVRRVDVRGLYPGGEYVVRIERDRGQVSVFCKVRYKPNSRRAGDQGQGSTAIELR